MSLRAIQENGIKMHGSKTQNYLYLLCLVLLPAIVYFRVASFDFTLLDDKTIIQDHYSIIGNIKNIPLAFQTDAFLNKPGKEFYRPVQTASYMIDAAIGGDKPFIYHLTNLLIHILTVISLYFLLVYLQIKKEIAFGLSLLFSIHPLFSSAVSWIPARGDLLLTLFCVLSFSAFIKYNLTNKLTYFILHLFLLLLVVFTKETGILLPLFLFLYCRVVLKEKVNNKKLLIYLVSWILIVLLYLLARNKIITTLPSSDIFGIAPLIKNIPAIPATFGKLFIPYHLSTLPLFDYISITLGILLLLVTAYLLFKSKRQQRTWILFGFLWFLAFTIIPLFYRQADADFYVSYFEHRTYLPVIGIVIAAAFILNDSLSKLNQQLLKYGFLCLAIIFSMVSFLNSSNYENSLSFYSKAIDINPELNAAAYSGRANVFIYQGDLIRAMEDYNSSLEIHEEALTYYNRGLLQSAFNNHELAEEDLTKSIALDSTNAMAFYLRSVERLQRKNALGALEDLDKTGDLKNLADVIFIARGNAYSSLHDSIKALSNFSKAIEINNRNDEAYYRRGLSRFAFRDVAGAMEDYKKAIEINPAKTEAYISIGQSYGFLHQFDSATIYFNKTLEILPNSPQAYFGRGLAKKEMKDLKGACEDLNKAASLGNGTAKKLLDEFCN